MDKGSEIISMVERRRHWPAEEKLRIMEEVLAPGVTLALYNFECFTGFNVERGAAPRNFYRKSSRDMQV
jgi:hypothetical protein